MSDKKISLKNTNTSTYNQPDILVKDISALIDEARNHVAREYNSTQALLCWLIGKRINWVCASIKSRHSIMIHN